MTQTNRNSHDLKGFISASSKGLGGEMQGNLPRGANPSPDSLAIMHQIDSLPQPWRALVHEYGFKAVMGVREDGKELDEAEDALWMARSARQAQWLATDFISKRSFASV